MQAFTDKLNEIEAKITEREAGGFRGRAADVKKLKEEREAHIKQSRSKK